MINNNMRVVGIIAVASTVTVVAGTAAFIALRRKGTKGVGTVVSPDASADSPGLQLSGSQVPLEKPNAPLDTLLSSEDRSRAMQLFGTLKQKANLSFQEGRYDDAVRQYQDCIEVTTALGAADAEAVAAEQVIRANVVMAFLKLQQYEDARLVASMLLDERVHPLSDDIKVKVLYRRGLASKSIGDKAAALADFKAAIHFSPAGSNPAAQKEIDLLSRA